MKKYYYSSAFLILSTLANAQQAVIKTYGSAADERAWALCKNADGGYTITGEIAIGGAANKDLYAARLNALGDTLWTKRFGGANEEIGESVMQTADGGFIFTGDTKSAGAGGKDFYLLKTNSAGSPVWCKTVGGSNNEEAYSVIQTSDSGYVMAGYTASTGAGGDAYLVKTNAAGTLLWTKTFGSAQYDGAYSVIQAPDSGLVLTGVTQSYGAGGNDVLLIKTDASGNLLWSKTYGGIGDDWGYCVRNTLDGGFIISGHTASFGQGEYDILLLKTNSNGSLQWSKTYGKGGEDIGWYLQQAADSSYIIAGNAELPGIDHHGAYLLKIDKTGNQVWNKSFGKNDTSAIVNSDVGVAVVITAAGGYAMAGHTNSFGAGGTDGLMVKTDAIGSGGCYDTLLGLVAGTPAILTGSPSVTATPGSNTTAAYNTPATATATVITNVCGVAGIGATGIGVPVAVVLYPNPAGDYLSIYAPLYKSSDAVLEVSDFTGRLLIAGSFTTRISVAHLPPGMYTLTIRSGGNYSVQKFVKQ